MYYCSRSKNIAYSPDEIRKRMKEVLEQFPVVALQPPEGDINMVGDLNLSRPVVRLIIRYRVLLFWLENPPDPRGDKMFCRLPPYFIHVSAKELALAVNRSLRSVQRTMRMVHEELQLKKRAQITVDEFCRMSGYNDEDTAKIHQNLAFIREGKWKKIKDRQRKKEDDKS